MVVLRSRVTCCTCQKPVDKFDTRLMPADDGQRVYECFICFKKKRAGILVIPDQDMQTKQDLYCERCKYKFRSRKYDCPYCNKGDMVVAGKFSVSELL